MEGALTSYREEADDKELIDELHLLVDKVKGSNPKLIPPTLNMLKAIIRSSTTSMTSVPKPLKYLSPYYNVFKEAYDQITDPRVKNECADIVSVLAMCPTGGNSAKEKHDCLHYCLLGTRKIEDWGHEYIRQLESEIVEEWALFPSPTENVMSLIRSIIKFDCTHHAEIQACDLLMEIDQLEMLPEFVDESTYSRICLYLSCCAKYVDQIEANKIVRIVIGQYLKFNEHIKAIILAIQLNDRPLANRIFNECTDGSSLRQMAFIATRQLFPIEIDTDRDDYEELATIFNNSQMSTYFAMLARELDVAEPKTPEEVYKTWLEPTLTRTLILGENLDSARQNLASSFVNGFVNAGFGKDKLVSLDNGHRWIYRNKDYGMMSATATLGLLYMWDVDGGLSPIDKYLYIQEDYIKGGALLALGIVNCRIRNEYDPALALLSDYMNAKGAVLTGAVFGLGLAYIGSNRDDVLSLLVPVVENAQAVEYLAVASLACGLVAVGSGNFSVVNAILTKLVDARETFPSNSQDMRMIVLGLGLCYLGCKDAIDTSIVALEVLAEPFKTTAQCLLKMCAYAGTGDVLIIQELLQIMSNRIVVPTPSNSPKDKKKARQDDDTGVAQAAAVVAVAAIAIGEDTGGEMCQRILGDMGRYGDLGVRRAVPLAIALLYVSRPHLPIIDILTKYAHDTDEEVSCSAIFSLGIVGAGTNNARLSAGLRQMAVFHKRNPSQLFMVRLAQGLAHLGKGTLTLNPMHTDRLLMDPCSMAGILIPLISLFDVRSVISGGNHYLLFALAGAMYPRWLLTLDENLEPLFVTVRVGQAVDIVGKAGTPKTISGIHTHTTPMLLAAGERAELATDQYEQLAPTLDGICILKKKPE
ncbi:hypothetical protein PPYR_13523 [Photinus pyralis]|uniref:26S proteasome non-ATPase regulatory subunit 2 n=1 Tax=Photinus pyralis TaxID=7054 RepID=A0A5N4A9A9_PHOPY|nr:26S proteasome non-ATPase regulatory subunit 2-like isoform X2 [Photinus pyralis]KAB0793903.1 hypothetical protein PPYR_13523 [Photinus pyralis]